MNHYENINSAYHNIHVYWGAINPIFYNLWDYDLNEPINLFTCNIMDLNQDNIINVIDIITVVNIIVGSINPNQYESCAADTNGDQIINVIDIIAIVNTIISS